MCIIVGIVLYCRFLYYVYMHVHIVICLIMKERWILQTDPVKFVSNHVLFMLQVFPTKAESPIWYYTSVLTVLQVLLPT